MKLYLVCLFACLVLIKAEVDSKNVETSSQFRNSDSNEGFNFENSETSSTRSRSARTEQGYTDGNQVGSYSFSNNNDGRTRTVKFVGNGQGYGNTDANKQATTQNLPTSVALVSSADTPASVLIENAPQPQVLHTVDNNPAPVGYVFPVRSSSPSGHFGAEYALNVLPWQGNNPNWQTATTGSLQYTNDLPTQDFHFSTASHVPYVLNGQTGAGPQSYHPGQKGSFTATGPTLSSTLGRGWHLMPVTSGSSPFFSHGQAPYYGNTLTSGTNTGTQVGEAYSYQPTGVTELGESGPGTSGGTPVTVSFVPYGSNQIEQGSHGAPQYAPTGQVQPIISGAQVTPTSGPSYYNPGSQFGSQYTVPQQARGPVVPYAAVGGQGSNQYHPSGPQAGGSAPSYATLGGQGSNNYQPVGQGVGQYQPGNPGPVVSYAAVGGQGLNQLHPNGPQIGGHITSYVPAGGQGPSVYQPGTPVVPYTALIGQGVGQYQPGNSQTGGLYVPYAGVGGQTTGQHPGNQQTPGPVVTYTLSGGARPVSSGPGVPLGYSPLGGVGYQPLRQLVTYAHRGQGSSPLQPGVQQEGLVVSHTTLGGQGQVSGFYYPGGTNGAGENSPTSSYHTSSGQSHTVPVGDNTSNSNTLHYATNSGPNSGQVATAEEGQLGTQEVQPTGRSANLGNIAQTNLQNW